jgi:integrase
VTLRGQIRNQHGKWFGVVYLGRGTDGKKKYKWLKATKRKREAEIELGKALPKVQQGKYTIDGDMSLSDFLTKWLKSKKREVRDSTHAGYDWAIRLYITPELGKIPLQKLRPLHVADFLADMKEAGKPKSATSQRAIFDVLYMALEQAVGWEMIETNPCHKKKIKPPSRAEFHPTVLTEEQLGQLLDAAREGRFLLPIMLGSDCGLRRGEICGLQWDDVDLERATMHIRYSLDWHKGALQLQTVKTQRSDRPVNLSAEMVDLLKRTRTRQKTNRLRIGEAYQDRGFVWCWEDGRPYDPDYLYHEFEQLLEDAKLPKVRVHDLRHTHATILLQNGADIKVVQERLGHVNAGFTLQTYGHLLPGRQQQAADIMDAVHKKPKKVAK